MIYFFSLAIFFLLWGFSPEVYAQGFDANQIFPAWGSGGQVQGVIGSNTSGVNSGEGRLIIYFIPKAIEILITVTAPIVFVMFLMAGIRYITANSDEETLNKARDFFRYGIIGVIFIVISYSLMKGVYFVFA